MEAEMMNSPSTKEEYSKMIKSYKKEIEMLKTQVRKDEDSFMFKFEKDALLQYSKAKYLFYKKIFVQQQQRQQEVESIEIQNNKLHNGLQQLYEADQLADGIEQNLHQQSEQMLGTMGKLKQIFGELTTSNRFVSGMKNRIIKNKAICYGSFLIIILIIILIFLFKFL